MAFTRRTTAGGGDFAPVPEGTHRAVCIQIVDMGTQPTNFGDKRQVRIAWEVDELMEDGRPFLASKLYTLSLHEKATLRKDLESWRGAKYGEDEEVDIAAGAGKTCMLSIVHDTKGEKTYSNVAAVLKPPKGTPNMDSVNDVVVLDLDSKVWGDVIGKLPDWLQEKILKSPESRGIDPTAPNVATKAPTGTVGPEVSDDFDDPIPF